MFLRANGYVFVIFSIVKSYDMFRFYNDTFFVVIEVLRSAPFYE